MHLGRPFGIKLELHFTFILLVLFYGWMGWRVQGLPGAVINTTAIILIFGCVVLHELGHSLVARHYGIGIRRILLLPIGGMAEFERIPRTPKKELLITLAGPAVNFFIAAALILFGGIMPENFLQESLTFHQLLNFVLFVNLVMGFFNLIPVFPMDGGRILRAILAFFLPYIDATRIAVYIGKILAIVGIAYAILYAQNIILVLLFAFIFFSGDREYQFVRQQERLRQQWQEAIRAASQQKD
ncbi:MAG TPA: hypothetical protein DIU37_00505 [Opitutae bacterium]|nr:hypothetical protein [Opitutae bacterium]|tara:strand:+ start:396 stop:1121 length:726 start_codon:yes stop_codon:yes gene_type:complete